MHRFSAPERLAILTLALAAIAGCRVEHKSGSGHDDVNVVTPFGGLQVNTDGNAVLSDVGLSPYPGATPLHDKDNGTAAVNFNFGSLHLGVHVVTFRTPDPPDKVLAFYRKDLVRYGVVIQCQNGHPVGSPSVTPDGLGCEEDKNSHMYADEHGSVGELKTGSRQHQHVVALDRDGSGTKFGLVSLELPAHGGDGKED